MLAVATVGAGGGVETKCSGTDMTMSDVEYLLSKLESLLEETTHQRSEIQGLVDVIQGCVSMGTDRKYQFKILFSHDYSKGSNFFLLLIGLEN
jgi:hypothetical protein